jgi:very-short-patch-repair endonuclease
MQNKNLTQIARKLRKEMTPEEHILWYRLRSKRFSGYKFRRQFPLDKFVADFVCLAKRLIVEADGGQHNQNAYDVERDKYLQSQNFTILRFWNSDINQNLESVLQKIYNELQKPSP